MRSASTFMLLSATAFVASAEDAEVPYTAFVLSDNAPIRSAPAKVHYPTTHLSSGTKIEVYRHDPGGWLAIRPPRGSFSVVPAKYLKLAEEPGIAHVTEANIAALVAAERSSTNELIWQVRLKEGEAVELLGVSTDHGAGDSNETWYKIAPPAGEFRWIHERFVTRDPSAIAAHKDSHPTSERKPAAESKSAPPLNDVATPSDDGFVARKKRPSNSAHPVAAPPPIEHQPQPSPSVDAASTATPADDLLNQIALLDVELSLMVAGDESSWHTNELKQRGEALLNQATSNLERGRARLLLNRIEEFQELGERYEKVRLHASPDDLAAGAADEKPDRLVVDEATEIGTGLRERLNQPGTESAEAKFDGSGYLMPVHSKRPDVPPFALVDGTGRIVQYVTPAPGLNLHRYRKLEIGVFGQRGFVPTLQTPHVTAQRIIVLERHR